MKTAAVGFQKKSNLFNTSLHKIDIQNKYVLFRDDKLNIRGVFRYTMLLLDIYKWTQI